MNPQRPLRSSSLRLIQTMLSALAALLLLPALGAQEIVNPGFEQELSDWISIADGDMSRAVGEAARSGGFGLRVDDQSDKKGSGLESLPSEAVPGKKYEVTFWARAVSGTGGVAVSLRFLDENKKGLLKKSPTVIVRSGADWQKFSVSGTAPELTAALCIRIHSLAAESATVDFDDFEIHQVPLN